MCVGGGGGLHGTAAAGAAAKRVSTTPSIHLWRVPTLHGIAVYDTYAAFVCLKSHHILTIHIGTRFLILHLERAFYDALLHILHGTRLNMHIFTHITVVPDLPGTTP